MKSELFIKTFGDKKNPSIIFVHGFPFDHQLWTEQINTLKKTFYCICYDVRGLGKSEVGDGQYTMEKYSDDLINLVKELELKDPVLCGMSMGGYIILRTLEKREELFSGAILIDTKSGADNDFVKLKRAEAIKTINVKGLKFFNNEFIKPLFWNQTSVKTPQLINIIIRRANKANEVGVKGAIIAMLSRTDTSEVLRELNLPVLILCGKYDNLTTPEVMKEMADSLKYSEFYVVPKAGHMAPVENPEFINKKINSFLKKIFR